jgi:5-methyltetrahydropteroyltriglutamate--homocysteine methyltransferase
MANNYTYHADTVGLLLAPEAGDTTPSPAMLDEWIKRALIVQRTAGLGIMTDGELRRHGLAEALLKRGQDKLPPALVDEEAAFLLRSTNLGVKISLPTPASALRQLAAKAKKEGRAFDEGAAAAALVASIRAEIDSLLAAGVAYIQLNGSVYGPLLDEETPDSVDAIKRAAALDAEVLAGLQRPANARIGLRLGRPGPSPRWPQGAVTDGLATLFQLPVDRLLLDIGALDADYGFLSTIPKDKLVVLGLLSTTSPELESQDAVLESIDRAAAAVGDGHRVALSPRGGFTRDSGLTWDDQRRKLELLVDIVLRWWGFAM